MSTDENGENDDRELLVRAQAAVAKLYTHCLWADGEIARLRGLLREEEEAEAEDEDEDEDAQETPELTSNGAAARACSWTLDEMNRLFHGAKATFSIDFDIADGGAPTANLFVMRGDRSVLLEVLGVVDAHRRVVRFENTVTCSVAIPSLDRVRQGYRGELANSSSEEIVSDAGVEDLGAALQWLAGKEEHPPKGAPKSYP